MRQMASCGYISFQLCVHCGSVLIKSPQANKLNTNTHSRGSRARGLANDQKRLSRLPQTLSLVFQSSLPSPPAATICAPCPRAAFLCCRRARASGACADSFVSVLLRRLCCFGAWGCGVCKICERREENLCQNPIYPGVMVDGGWAEKLLVQHPRNLVKLNGLDPVIAAPLTDAALTPYRAVKKVIPKRFF